MKVKVKSILEVGCHKYKVSFDDTQEDGGWDGTTLHRREEILLNPQQPELRMATCYIHEALHIIARVYAIDLKEDDVWRLSEGLGEVLVRNLGITLDFSNIQEK